MDPLALDDADLQFTDLCFHPSTNLIGSAVITGDVVVYKYGPDGHTESWRLNEHHNGGVRCVKFSENGNVLYSTGSDGTLKAVDSETGSSVWAVEGAHSDAINAMVSRSCHVITGDDQGSVKQWDTRSPPRISVVNDWKEQSDYISDLHVALDGRFLLSTSGDTTLTVLDLRSKKRVRRSDPQEDELLCVEVLKAGRKVVCGTQNGVLLVWSWGTWGDCSDRFPGFPPDISAIELVDEDTVVIGGSDGLLYSARLQPNAIMGKLGGNVGDNHINSSNSSSLLPVERLAFSGDRQWLGWVSHDEKIRFLDAASLLRIDGDCDDDGSSEEDSSGEDEESCEDNGSLSESEGQDGHKQYTGGTIKRKRFETDDDPSDSHGSCSDEDNNDVDSMDDRDSENSYCLAVDRKKRDSKQPMSNAERFFLDL